MDESFDTLLAFFKALADANRLKLIGLLAQKESSVEELAAMLDINPSTVSHHLAKLAEIKLVSARAEGYYSIYRLETTNLERMARQLLAKETLPEVAKDLDRKAYDRKVLKDYLREDGTIEQLPTNRRKLDVILRYLLEYFEFGKIYTEKQVNTIIGGFYADISGLRRDLISVGYMDRERDGSAYWRVDESN
ncbi:MAG: metalloregulator ArsR/SmtB family transcription factor [Chloroflexota bacterium]|nr:metalloregulator ArsR/SmtB family transcription factor [Chloroflexota bacterium]